ncbi:MAG: methionyl-tRNA formyltransferase [Gemmatimonadetes bacterium]|nr:methionyl-tRNA formyltransferase [Gemmatimonadota bacterium]
MKLLFMGTPEFAVPSLRRLAASRHEVAAVVTNPDRPRGRGRRTSPAAVKAAAAELGLPCLQPESVAEPGLPETLSACGCDLFVVVAFSILPDELLAVPPMGAINLHPSLLPAYRGAAPVPWTLFNGEGETGVTTILLDSRVDAGDILLQKRVAVARDETAGELEGRLAELGGKLVVATIDGLESGEVHPRPQPSAGASRAPKLSREHGRLIWSLPTESVRNRIRGANPVPGAFTTWRDRILKIHRAHACDETPEGPAGTVLAADGETGLVVSTGDGALAVDEIQPSGRNRMTGEAFLRGYQMQPGDRFGE